MSKKRNYPIVRQTVIPGFESGRFEPRRPYDRTDFTNSPEENRKRDRRITVRVAGEDLSTLERMARAEGIPTQSLLARVLHQYAAGELQSSERECPPTSCRQDAAPQTVGPATSREG